MDKVRAKRIAAELKGLSVSGWTIGEYIDNGASAVVLTAERGGQTAALKLMDPELIERYGEEHQLARIRRERVLVDHDEPHLVKIFDGGQCENTGYLFVAMELLTQPKLTALVASFPRERIGPIIQQIAHAARFLEARGLAHRDIKPDNISITRDCETAILLDLGVLLPVAQAAARDAGSGDEFLGTTRYSPPEYVMREEDGSPEGWRAVTFYQLGGVLHDLIMRRQLFDGIGPPPARLIDAVRTMRPTIDAQDVPAHLITLARSCLQKDWRLRLELVHWDHFGDRLVPPGAGDAKTRIRQRLALADSASSPVSAVPAPSRRRLLNDLGGSLASVVRETCVQAGTFPPIEVRSLGDGDDDRLVSIRTGPSNLHRLNAPLTIRLAYQLLDDEGLFVRIMAAAGLGEVSENTPSTAWRSVYSGEASAGTLRERVDDLLHLALEAAQEIELGESYLFLQIPPSG
jgi:eukaryotic-like serine/threonine-protein kinase